LRNVEGKRSRAVTAPAALKAMAQAEPELMQAAQRNIIHKNNASRKVSRLTHTDRKARPVTGCGSWLRKLVAGIGK